MFPVVYVYREESGVTRTVAILLAVFMAPALAPVLTRVLHAGTVLVAGAIGLGALRVALQATSHVNVGVATIAAAVGLFALATSMVVFRHRCAMLVVALIGGLALDTVIRVAWSTLDIVWQHGVGPWAVTVTLVAGLLIATAWARTDARESRGALAVLGLALGPYLALQVWFLQSPALVASSATVALATAAGVILCADVLAIAAIAWVIRLRKIAVVMLGAAVLAILAGVLLPSSTETAALAVVVGGQIAASMLFASAASPLPRQRSGATWHDTAGILAGSVIFGAIVLLYQLHYDRPLPFSNRVLPVIAFAVLSAVGLAPIGRSRTREASTEAMAFAGAIVLSGIALVAGVALGEPDLATANPGRTLRVVTYNPHETVTRSGQLDPEAFATAVERLRPDVLVVEEAGRGWPLSSGLDLAEWTKRRLGMRYDWAPAADHQFGNLLFSRVPIHDARVVRLPQGAGTMKRSALVARLGPIGGEIVQVVGVHLQNGSKPAHHETRLREIRTLRTALRHGPLRNTVLAGDLNSDPGSRELRALRDLGFVTRQPTERCTLRTSNEHCSDWIFVTPDLDQRGVRVLPFDAFDHRPVLSEITTRADR